MFLLDTNVISELRKGDRADSGVRTWVQDVDPEALQLSVLVVGEIRLGIERLRRRDVSSAAQLDGWLDRVEAAYRNRVLDVDVHVVHEWARLSVDRPLPIVDALMAATANVHGLTLVTRNVGDLDGVHVAVLNPFAGAA